MINTLVLLDVVSMPTNDSIIEVEKKIIKDAEESNASIGTLLFFCYNLNVNVNLLRFWYDNYPT
jgi:hypothetical protein